MKMIYCRLRFQWGTTSRTSCQDAKQHCLVMIMHLISENLYKRAIQEITTTCSMYLCSKSFLMCQWRQRPPNNFDRLSNYCATSSVTDVSSLLGWMWKCGVLCRPLLESFHNGGSECSVWHWGITWLALLHKGQSSPCALCLSMCPFSTRPRTPSGLRETLAFELLSCHFVLLENRERRREHWLTFLHQPLPKSSVHPSRHPWDWVSAYSVHDYYQAASQALLVRPQDCQSTPTLSSGLSLKVRVQLPVQFLLFKTIAAFSKTLDL